MRVSRKAFSTAAVLLLAGGVALGQAANAGLQNPGPTIKVNSRIALVDVVVRSKGQEPVSGLTRENFHVTENGVPQKLISVEEHTVSAGPAPGAPALPHLPPHTYTNYRPAGEGNSIILLDALNTPVKDQTYVRQQLLAFLKEVPAGTSFAVFTLGSQLRLLQPFSADPAALRAALNSGRANPQQSDLLTSDQAGPPAASTVAQEVTDDHLPPPGTVLSADLAANLRQFEAEQDTFNTEFRIRLTMTALAEIAAYVDTRPGRKNLIWVSGSFPATILPNAALGAGAFAATSNLSPLIRRTTDLLSAARISVYPIDARGLMNSTTYSAQTEQASHYYSPSHAPMDKTNMAFLAGLASDHAAMSSVADETGGRAYFNTNGIRQAMASALDDGGHYYTLAYVPEDRKPGLRRISVKLSPGNYELNYRKSYFAGDTTASAEPGRPMELDAVHAAFEAGAPDSPEILFDVSVQRIAAGAVAPTPVAGAVKGWKGPAVHYAIEYAVRGSDIHPTLLDDGKSRLALDFVAIDYDDTGRALNQASESVTADLPPAKAAALQQSGFPFHQEIIVPAKQTFLKVGVAEKDTGRVGTLEVILP